MDVTKSFGLTGRQAETALREAKLTVNRNAIPFDVNGPWYTSGVRLGTPALTTLGMREAEMCEVADIIATLLRHVKPEEGSRAKVNIEPKALGSAQKRVKELLEMFPLYPELVVD